MPRIVKRLIITLVIIVVALIGAGAWYVSDYYHADATALAAMGGDTAGASSDLGIPSRNSTTDSADQNSRAAGESNVPNTTSDELSSAPYDSSPLTTEGQVNVQPLTDKAIAFVPAEPRAGFIFYPGGKVQPEAYAPLMRRCAEQGILCILVKPTFNLAILDPAVADGLQGRFPAVDRWYIGGHSLGGAVASQYAADHPGSFGAVVLLGSYSMADLTAFDGDVLLAYGSNDQVLNRQKYDEAKRNLPASARELVIEGGNHAQFGNYGEQAGDGEASISAADQQAQTATLIAAL